MPQIIDFNQVDNVLAQQKTLQTQALDAFRTSRGYATALSPELVRIGKGKSTFGDALGAAFLQENILVSGLSRISPTFTPVPGFNNSPEHKAMLGPFKQYVDDFPELVTAESPKELLSVQRQIQKEVESRAILENVGFFEGLLYYLPAGILSPENLLPIATAVRGVGLGAKTVGKLSAARAAAARTAAYEINPMTGTVARTAAGQAMSKQARKALLLRAGVAKNTIPQIAGLSAAEGALSGAVAEVILNAQQGLRTSEEMVMGVVGGGVFGGILGTGFAGIGKGYRASLEQLIGHEYLTDAVNDANAQYSRALVNALDENDVDVAQALRELQEGIEGDAQLKAQEAWEKAIEVVDGKVAGPIKRLAGFKEEGWLSTIAKKVAWLNPNIQLALSKSNRAYSLGEVLSSSPLIRVADNSLEKQGEFTRPAIESMIHLVELDAFRKIQTVNTEFKTYKKGGGKLDQQTFNELVGRLHRRGGDFTRNDIKDLKENGSSHFPGVERLDDADLALLKSALIKSSEATGKFFDSIKQLAMQTGAFTRLSDSETVGNIVQYFAREYDIDKIKLDREGFAQVLRDGRQRSIEGKKKSLQLRMRAVQDDINYLNARVRQGVADQAERDEILSLIEYKKELTEDFKNVRDVSELKIQETIDKILGEAESTNANPNNGTITARIKNFLERTLDISDEDLEDFLISDADYIMGKMVRHTLPDLLLAQYLGSSQVSKLLMETEAQLITVHKLNKIYQEDPSDANAKSLVKHMQDLRTNLNKLNMINAFRTVPETTRKDLQTGLNEILDIEEGEFSKGAERISQMFDERNEIQEAFNKANDEVRKLQMEYAQSRERIRQLREQMSDTSDFDNAVTQVIQAADRAELEKLHKEDMEEAVQTRLEETEEYTNAKKRAEDAGADFIDAQIEAREDGKSYADAVATEFADGIEVVQPRRAGQTAKEMAEAVAEEPATPEAPVSGKVTDQDVDDFVDKMFENYDPKKVKLKRIDTELYIVGLDPKNPDAVIPIATLQKFRYRKNPANADQFERAKMDYWEGYPMHDFSGDIEDWAKQKTLSIGGDTLKAADWNIRNNLKNSPEELKEWIKYALKVDKKTALERYRNNERKLKTRLDPFFRRYVSEEAEIEVTTPFKKRKDMDEDLYPYYEGSIDGIPIRLVKDEDGDGKPLFVIDEEFLGEAYETKKEGLSFYQRQYLKLDLELENTLEKSIEELKRRIEGKKFPFEETQGSLSRKPYFDVDDHGVDLSEGWEDRVKYVKQESGDYSVMLDDFEIARILDRKNMDLSNKEVGSERWQFEYLDNENMPDPSSFKEAKNFDIDLERIEKTLKEKMDLILNEKERLQFEKANKKEGRTLEDMGYPATRILKEQAGRPRKAEYEAPEPEAPARVEETVEPEALQATSAAEFLNNRYNRATNENVASDGLEFDSKDSTVRDSRAERKRAEERAEWARNQTELEYLVGAIEELLELEALPQKVAVKDLENTGTVPSIRKNGDRLVGHTEASEGDLVEYTVKVAANGTLIRYAKVNGKKVRVKRNAVTHIHGRKKGEVDKLPPNQALSIIQADGKFRYVDELELENAEVAALVLKLPEIEDAEVRQKIEKQIAKKLESVEEMRNTAVPARNTRGASSQYYFEDYLDFLEKTILEPAPEGSGKMFKVKKDYFLAVQKLRFGAARSEELDNKLTQRLKELDKVKRQAQKEMAEIESKTRKKVERELTLDKEVNEIMEDFVGGGVMAVGSRGTKVANKIKETLETYKVKEDPEAKEAVKPEEGKKPKKPPKPFVETIEELLYAKNKTEMSAETRTLQSEIEVLLRKLDQKRTVRKRYAEKRKEVDSRIYRLSQILGAARNAGNGHRPVQFNYDTRTRVRGVFDPQKMASAVEGLIGATSNIRRNSFRDQLSLDPHFRVIDMEYKREIEKATTTKQIGRLEKDRERDKELIATMVSRLRNTDGFSDEAQFAQKASRILRNYNYLRSMGGVVISSIPDIVMGISTAGFSNYARAWAKFIQREWTEKGKHRDDMAMLLWAGETVLGRNRAASVFDTEQPYRRTAGSGLMDKMDYMGGVAADRFSRLSGTNLWNGMMKSISAVAIQSRIIQISKRRAAGKSVSKSDQAFMNFIGINNQTAVDIARIHDGMADATDNFMGHTFYYSKSDKWSGSINGVSASRVDNAKNIMEAAVRTGVNNTVLTPNAGVIPPELTTWWGRLLNQFRSFMLQSTETIVVSGSQRAVAAKDMNQVITVLGLTFMGTMVYALKEALMGRDAVSGVLEGDEEQIRKVLFNGLDRGGALAMPMEINNIIHSLAGGGGPINKIFGVSEEAGRFRQRDFISTISAPMGTVEDVAKAVTSLFSRGIDSEEDLFKGDRTRLRRVMPYQNLWWLSVGLDVVPNFFGSGTYYEPNYRMEERVYELIGGEPEPQKQG